MDAVVSGNRDRLFYSDDYNDNYFKQEGLRLQRAAAALDREKFEWSKQKDALSLGYQYDPSTGKFVSPVGGPIEFTDYRRMGATANRTEQVQQNAAYYIQ